MIESLYQDYFQKSRVFLYPALGISRYRHEPPSNTFVSWQQMFSPQDTKLICLYEQEVTPELETFEREVLTTHPFYHTGYTLDDGRRVHVFDYSLLQQDWDRFLEGHYSQLSQTLKTVIMNYYGKKSRETPYVRSYLYPEEFYEVYAKLLEIDSDLLRQVGELCDRFDPDREELKIPVDRLLKPQESL